MGGRFRYRAGRASTWTLISSTKCRTFISFTSIGIKNTREFKKMTRPVRRPACICVFLFISHCRVALVLVFVFVFSCDCHAFCLASILTPCTSCSTRSYGVLATKQSGPWWHSRLQTLHSCHHATVMYEKKFLLPTPPTSLLSMATPCAGALDAQPPMSIYSLLPKTPMTTFVHV